jgi:CheY-like chemotaxis protein
MRAQPQTADTLLIALTGYGTAQDRAQSLEAGFDHHVLKPVDPAAIERLVAGERRTA